MKIILNQDFFNRSTLQVARDLLGKHLVFKSTSKTTSLIINEVEAYDGPEDKACHGRFGKTKRTTPMFGSAGHLYVYLVYGIHWMLNIVVGPKDYPAAILIRGAGHLDGPAKLTKFLRITSRQNGKPANKTTGLWFEDRGNIVTPAKIIRTPRIGIDYAGPVWSQKQYGSPPLK
jgi:DNA-3-methyladenine glycosylase